MLPARLISWTARYFSITALTPRKRAPLVRRRGFVTNDFQVIRTGVKGEPQRHGSSSSWRLFEPLPDFDDLIENSYLTHMVVADGRVVMAQRPSRHDAEQENARLVIQRSRYMEVGQRRG